MQQFSFHYFPLLSKVEALRESDHEDDLNISPGSDTSQESESFENQLSQIVTETAKDDCTCTCNFCGETFSEGDTLEYHMICHHKVAEDCSSCYGCGEEFREDLPLGRFLVLWDKGKVGGDGEVAAECFVCMHSPVMTSEELKACIKSQIYHS